MTTEQKVKISPEFMDGIPTWALGFDKVGEGPNDICVAIETLLPVTLQMGEVPTITYRTGPLTTESIRHPSPTCRTTICLSCSPQEVRELGVRFMAIADGLQRAQDKREGKREKG